MRRFPIVIALLLTALLVSLPSPAQDVISTFIGGGPNGIPALDADLYNPYGVAVDSSGNFYIAAYNQNRVFKVSTGGTISVVAGSGALGYSGDGVVGGAGNADLHYPWSVAVDSSGNVYFADNGNCVVRKVSTAGTITTIAGTGQCGFSGDGGKGIAAQLNSPTGTALDGLGNLFIGDYNNCRVRKLVLSTNIISTYAGSNTGCGYSGDGGAATSAQLNGPGGLAADSAGDLFIGDTQNYVIREVTKSSGKISTIAGNHAYGFGGDGGAATSAQMTYAYGLAVNGAGTTVTFADYANQRVRQFTVGGKINTVAGTGAACSGVCGEGGAATSAQLYNPIGIAISSSTIYLANNQNYVVDKFTVGGNLNLVAGNHSYNTETLISGAPASGVVLNYPYQIFNDSSNNVYIADSHNFMVREMVKSSGLVNFFAGNGTYGYAGDGGTATSAEMTYDYGVAKDSSGNVYIADSSGDCLIRKVNTGGIINVFAGLVVSGGAGRCGAAGDGGKATSAELNNPQGVAVDSHGNIYIADTNNHAVREVSGGVMTTIAGILGVAGYGGDGGPAVNAFLNTPAAVAVDVSGNVFIADYNNCRIREIIALTGIITTVAGNGYCAFTGDGIATENGVAYPQGIAVDANGNVFFSDNTQRVRWASPSGIMTTIAGNGQGGFNGDGGPALAAQFNTPTGVALDTAGNILVSDFYNLRVRKITAFPALATSAGSVAFGLTTVGSTSSPQLVTVSAFGPVTISNISITGAFSEADNCPSNLTSGSTCAMYVYFAPTASGTSTGSITINSNGFFNPVNTVYLSGKGAAISLTGAPMSFGNQLVKTTSAVKTATVKNNGTTAVTMGTISLTESTDFAITANTCPASGNPLAGGVSCSISVDFAPKSTGTKKGAVVINDSDPTSPQVVGLSGTGISKVVLSPTSVTFATTPVGVTSKATNITVTNNTGANLTLGNPAVTMTGPFVSTGSTTCTNGIILSSVSPGNTCILSVAFKPTAVGYATGTVRLADSDVTSPQTAALQGYGTGVKFTPGSVNFGTVTRGNRVQVLVTITNVGTTPIVFNGSGISGTNAADFSADWLPNAPCGNNVNSPLQPGKTCMYNVYFLPSVVGAEKATYLLYDNSVGSPQKLPLTGTGQ